MSSNVILKKKYPEDSDGILSIQMFKDGKRKISSLKLKINENDFNEFFEKEFNKFRRTKKFDYKYFNSVIGEKIDDYSIYVPVSNRVEKSFLVFFEKKILESRNPNTILCKTSVLNKMKKFKEYKMVNDILFSDIDSAFVKELDEWLLTNLKKASSRKNYYINIKTILRLAKHNEKCEYFKGLKLKSIYRNEKILNDNDIKKLLKVQPSEKNYYYVNMFLFAIFANGIRFSDLILIRNGDFKRTHLQVITKKTGEEINIHLNDKLIALLLNIYKLDSFDKLNPYHDIASRWLDDEAAINTKNITYSLERLLSHIETLPKNDFLFKDFIKVNNLNNYKKEAEIEMTKEQQSSITGLRDCFNSKLKQITISCKLSQNISSHSSRYTFVSIMLDLDVSILLISKMLGHSSMQTTTAYIEKNFGKKKIEEITNRLSNRYNF